MYYFFKSTIRSWRNHTIQAKPLEDAVRFQEQVTDSKNHWWDAQPILIAPPPVLTFAASSKAPMPDNFWTGTLFNLFSERLTRLLQEAGVRFETFPARLIDRQTGEELATAYEVFHLLERRQVIDTKHSSPGSFRSLSNARGMQHTNHSPELNEPSREERRAGESGHTVGANRGNQMMFRLEQQANMVVIHEALKASLDAEGITGCNYVPVDLDRYLF